MINRQDRPDPWRAPVAPVPEPVEFVRPLAQYAVRTPSKEYASGY